MHPSAAARAFALLPNLIKSGIRPSEGEPVAWHDRVIRVIGGVLIFLVLAVGFVAVVLEMLSR
jgi:hypothetical protein